MNENKFNIDFTFEVLKGCKWSCSGCLVDKQIQNDLDEDNLNNLFRFFDNLEINGYHLINFNIGPTDLFSSANMESALLASSKLAKRFKCVVINSTFLEPNVDWVELAKKIDPLFDGLELKLSIPVETEHIYKNNYRNILKNNIDSFVSNLKQLKYRKTYFLSNLHQYGLIEKRFREYSETFLELTNNHLNIIVNEGRLDLTKGVNVQTALDAIEYYNQLFDDNINRRSDIDIIDFTYANEHEGLDWDLIYRNGNIYFPPFIGEPFNTFHEYFCLGTHENWNVDSMLELRQRMMLDCLEYVADKECLDCQFLDICSARRLPNLMKILGRESCLAPKKAFIIRKQQIEK